MLKLCQLNCMFSLILPHLCFRYGTWLRVSIWLGTGLLVYVFYGRTHSFLKDAIYVPAKQVDEIYQTYRSSVS